MTEENPPKRRMSSFGPEEPSIRSLKTELEFLQKRHVAALKEHSVVQSRYLKNTDKLEKENRALKKERFELGEKLRRTEDAWSILKLEVEHRNEELKRLCGIEKRVEELEAALAVSPDANLYFKIKKLLLKYHPDKTDKNSETLPLDREEVTRDLLQLLEA